MKMSVKNAMLAQSVCRIHRHPLRRSSKYPDDMKIHDETSEEIDEALAHLVDGVRHAQDFRKQYLLELIDQMLDAKLTRGKQ